MATALSRSQEFPIGKSTLEHPLLRPAKTANEDISDEIENCPPEYENTDVDVEQRKECLKYLKSNSGNILVGAFRNQKKNGMFVVITKEGHLKINGYFKDDKYVGKTNPENPSMNPRPRFQIEVPKSGSLFPFVFMNVILLTMGIVVNILSGLSFVNSAYPLQGAMTLVFVWLPSILNSSLSLIETWWTPKNDSQTVSLWSKLIVALFPFSPAIRNLKLSISLWQMDQTLTNNFKLITQIRRDVFQEAVLLANLGFAPQFILQSAFVIKNGFITWPQCLSVIICFVYSTCIAVKIFYSVRVGRFQEHNPTNRMCLLVLPGIAWIVFANFFVMSFVVAYSPAIFFTSLMFILVVDGLVLASFIHFSPSQALKDLYKPGSGRDLEHFEERQRNANIQKLALATFVSSWLTPCAIWYNNIKWKTFVPTVLAAINFLVWILAMITLRSLLTSGSISFEVEDIAPVTYCFKNLQESKGINTPIQIFYHTLEFLNQGNLFKVIFVCEGDSNTNDYFLYTIFPACVTLVTFSFVFSICIQLIGNDKVMDNLVRICCCCCGRISHVGMWQDHFLQKHATKVTFPVSDKDLQDQWFGETVLHVVLSRKTSSLNLLQLGADPSIKDFDGQSVKDILTSKIRQQKATLEEFQIFAAIVELPSKIHLTEDNSQFLFRMIGKKNLLALSIMSYFSPAWSVKNASNESGLEVLAKSIEYNYWEINLKSPLVARMFTVTDYEGQSLLHVAARCGLAICLELALRINNNVDRQDEKYSRSALHDAALNGRTDCAMILIGRGANVDLKDLEGRTPLHLSAKYGSGPTAIALINNTARVNIKDNLGITPFHLAVKSGNVDCVRVLIQNHADKNTRDDSGMSPIHYAVKSAAHKVIDVLFEEHDGIDVNIQDQRGLTPLHVAVKAGSVDSAKTLLRHNAQVDATNGLRETPLHIATSKADVTMMKLLIANLANIEARDGLGRSPIHIGVAIKSEPVVNFLLDNFASVNGKTKTGMTPLHIAVEQNSISMVNLLIDNGADVNAKTVDGKSPLHLAAELRHVHILELLISRGGDFTSTTADGRTPIQLAAHAV